MERSRQFKPRLPFLKLLWNCLVLNNSEKNTIANFEAGARVVKKEKPPEGLPVSPKDLQTTTPSRHLPIEENQLVAPPAAVSDTKTSVSLVLRKDSISMNALRAVAHVATRVHAPSLRAAPISLSLRSFSITYSGGQASEGQGGFYGSGGSRKNTAQIKHHPEAVGDLEDIRTLVAIMENVEKLEEKLAESMASHGSSVNEESIELKVRSHWHSLGRCQLL